MSHYVNSLSPNEEAITHIGNNYYNISIRLPEAKEDIDMEIFSGIHSTMPDFYDGNFTGRERELSEIRLKLDEAAKKDKRRQRVGLCGMGGVGKTRIALRYALSANETRSTFFIKADNFNRAALGLLAIGRRVIHNFDQWGARRDKHKTLLMIKAVLEHKEMHPWILILDELDDREVLTPARSHKGLMRYLPSSESGQLVFTTRDRRLFGMAEGNVLATDARIDVNPLENDEAIKLFAEIAGSEHLLELRETEKHEFVEMLGALPLAIVQAASYIREVPGTSLRMFQKLYEDISRQPELFKFEAHKPTLEENLSGDEDESGDESDVRMSVIFTFELSYSQILATEQRHEGKAWSPGPNGRADEPSGNGSATDILHLLAFLDSTVADSRESSELDLVLQGAGIGPMGDPSEQITPREIATKILMHRYPNYNTKVGFDILRSFSLVHHLGCWIHPIIHDWSYRRLGNHSRQEYLQMIVEFMQANSTFAIALEGSWWGHLFWLSQCQSIRISDLWQLRHARRLYRLVKLDRDHICSGDLGIELCRFWYRLAEDAFYVSSLNKASLFIDEAACYSELAIVAGENCKDLAFALRSRLLQHKIRFTKGEESIGIDMSDIDQMLGSHEIDISGNLQELGDIRQQFVLHYAQCLVDGARPKDCLGVLNSILQLYPDQKDYETRRNVKVVIIAEFLKGRILAANTDLAKMEGTTAKALFDHVADFVEFVEKLSDQDRYTDENNLLRMLPIPLFKERLQVAESNDERARLCHQMMVFEARSLPRRLERRFGGAPQEWLEFLEQLKSDNRWIEIEAFAEAYTEHRLEHRITESGRLVPLHDIKSIIEQRLSIYKDDTDKVFQDIIKAWSDLHRRLGEAHNMLGKVGHTAARDFGAAFVLRMFLVKDPPRSLDLRSLVDDWKLSLRAWCDDAPSPFERQYPEQMLRTIEKGFDRQWGLSRTDLPANYSQDVFISATPWSPDFHAHPGGHLS